MTVYSACLPPTELEQFLLGYHDDEQAQNIESHLLECDECRQRLKALAAEDELVRALREPKSDGKADRAKPAEAPADLVQVLVPHFKRIARQLEETATPSSFATNSAVSALVSTFTAGSGAPSETETPLPSMLGRYEIRGLLGRGGMGTVLHGFDPVLNRSVAIKILQPEWVAEDGMAERLVKEARAAAAVEHDNIVSIYSVEVRLGSPCIVMPLLKGMSLHQRLAEVDGPLPLDEILRIARDAANGLAAAHAQGLIHCDIKPANIWLESPRDRAKILDFGLAIIHGDGEGDARSISGTPGYLAPEQARGLPLDQRTDIFSLGCVLYRMATGTAPFTGEKRMKALWTVLSDPPESANELNPQIPEALSELIERMMSRAAVHRPATVSDVIEVLDSIDRHFAELRGGIVRRRWLVAMFGAAVLGGAGVGGWALFAAPRVAKPVPVTFLGDEPGIDIIVRRDSHEWPLHLGPETTLSLPPGDYAVRPTTASEHRTLVPEQFVVTEDKSQIVRMAYVGELARHATHTQMVTGIAVMSGVNPPVIFSVGQDRALVRWEPAQKALPVFENLSYAARCIAISPDGVEIATAGGNKTVPRETVIELRSANQWDGPVRKLEGHTRIVTALAYSSDGVWLASGSAEGVLLWNRATGESQLLQELSPDGNPYGVASLAFSSDSRRLLTGGDSIVTLWDVATKERKQSRASGARAVGFIKEKIVAAGDDGAIRIWSENEMEPRAFVSIVRPILAMSVSTDGEQLLTGDADGNVRLWSVATGEMRGMLHGHSRAVQSVAYLGNGRQAVSAAADGTVRLWQLPFP